MTRILALVASLAAVPVHAQVRAIPAVKTGAMMLFAEPMNRLKFSPGWLVADAKVALKPDGMYIPDEDTAQLHQMGMMVSSLNGGAPIVALGDGRHVGFVPAQAGDAPYAASASIQATPVWSQIGQIMRHQLDSIHESINAGDAAGAMAKLRALFPGGTDAEPPIDHGDGVRASAPAPAPADRLHPRW